MSVERQKFIEERTAYRFVDRVVPADVFSDDQSVSLEIEDAGGVNSASPREVALSRAKFVGQIEKRGLRHFHRGR